MNASTLARLAAVTTPIAGQDINADDIRLHDVVTHVDGRPVGPCAVVAISKNAFAHNTATLARIVDGSYGPDSETITVQLPWHLSTVTLSAAHRDVEDDR